MNGNQSVEPTAERLQDRYARQFIIPTYTEKSALNSVAPIEIPPVPEQSAPYRSKIADYFTLTKPEITFLVTISAIAGFLLGTAGPMDLPAFFALIVGVALSSAGGAAFNHYIEREKDAQMRRTSNRPLPSGRINPTNVLIFAGLFSVSGVALLLFYCNLVTGVLAALTIVLYIFLYTPLKRHTKYNTFVGTIPGALPALGGWTAATGSFGFGGWIIFSILVIWQLPHFFALAWMYRKDYGRAGFQMLPVVEPSGRSTARQMLISAILLFFTSLLPSAVGLTGMLYFIGVFIIGLWLIATCVTFYKTLSNTDARRVLKTSVFHIPILVVLLIVDRLL